MSMPAIRVTGLSKRYSITHLTRPRDGLRHRFEQMVRSPLKWIKERRRKNELTEDFYSLHEVSFDIKRGDVVGIIGRNGAGKSTLLKILSRITEPTTGRIELNGQVACLLEVGTGFHPELTGRENIFLNGAILGMRRAEIRRKFDEIVAFSEIATFLDTPVKRYSSGMYVRLAFAVAAHLEPEIMIVDEVLAVGDSAFQMKCLAKMRDIANSGATIMYVSHNMSSVLNLCNTALCLERGRLVHSGTPDVVVRFYLEHALPLVLHHTPLAARTDRSGSGVMRLTACRFEDEQGRVLQSAISGMDLFIVLEYETKSGADCRNVDPGISLHTLTGETIFVFYSSYTGRTLQIKGPRGTLRCRIQNLPVTPGRYVVGARVVVSDEEADWPRDGVAFLEVDAGDFYGSGARGCIGATSFLVMGEWGPDQS